MVENKIQARIKPVVVNKVHARIKPVVVNKEQLTIKPVVTKYRRGSSFFFFCYYDLNKTKTQI